MDASCLTMSELIDKNEAALSAHEQICEIRYEAICARLKRLEQILIGSAGFIMVTLIAIVTKIH
jgi:hypothetical protein